MKGDTKASKSARTPKSQRGGFALGLIVGLLIGLALALGVALYITKVPIPFVNKVNQRTAEQDAAEAAKNRNWDPNAPLAGRAPPRPAPAASAPSTAEGASGPAAVAVLPPSAPGSAPAARGQRDPAAILSGQAARSTATGAEPFTYYVQAGAFSRPDDAEQQRARLAMLGVGARVMEREQSGRLVYRVRVGPFDTREEAETMQSRLGTASVEASLVRVER